MQQVTSAPRYDAWGFLQVWVPFGKPGIVRGERGDYTVSQEAIQNLDSISTLAGLPAYYFHPGVVTNDNFDDFKTVGTCTDKYRLTPDGGGDVLVKITDATIRKQILNKELTETSPAYLSNDIRVYNHIALIPPGYARGGSKMQILLEGQDPIDTETLNEIYTIPTEDNNMDETLGLIISGQADMAQRLEALSTQVANCVTACEAMATEDDVTMESEPVDAIEAAKVVYQEGFTKGILVGQILASAASHGYVGEDAEAAKAHVVTKAFPSMKFEGFSPDMMQGLFAGALTALAGMPKTVALVAEVVPVVNVDKSAKVSRLKSIRA